MYIRFCFAVAEVLRYRIREGEGRVGAKVREKKGWLEGLMGRGKK